MSPGPVFYLLLRVSSGCALPITGQVTSVTWPVIGWAESELTLSKRQKTGPGHLALTDLIPFIHHTDCLYLSSVFCTCSWLSQWYTSHAWSCWWMHELFDWLIPYERRSTCVCDVPTQPHYQQTWLRDHCWLWSRYVISSTFTKWFLKSQTIQVMVFISAGTVVMLQGLGLLRLLKNIWQVCFNFKCSSENLFLKISEYPQIYVTNLYCQGHGSAIRHRRQYVCFFRIILILD